MMYELTVDQEHINLIKKALQSYLCSIYDGLDNEVLDVDKAPGEAMLVQDLPYDIPVEDRVNVRKYTKQSEKAEDIHIVDEPFNFEDLHRLEKLFGIES